MKNKTQGRSKHEKAFLLILTLIALLCSSQPAFCEQVERLGSWLSGTTHAKETGTNRALIFIVHAEGSSGGSTPFMNAAAYGGQTMTKIVEHVNSGIYSKTYTAAFILNDAGITAAGTNSFAVSWGTAPSSGYYIYTHTFLQNVNQSALYGAITSNQALTGTTITASALNTSDGDMVLVAATNVNTGTYSVNNGFTEAIEPTMSYSDAVDGYKSATGASETPSVTHSSSGRQTIIGFVVQAVIDPNKASNPVPGNKVLNESIYKNLSWDAPTAYTPANYDVYFGTNSATRSNPKYTIYTNSFDPPGDLETLTKYYWAVDCNDNGTIYPGNDWNFTTGKLYDRVAGNMILMNDNGGWCWYQDEKIAYDPCGGNVLMSTTACYIGFGGVNGTRNDDTDSTTFNIDTGKRTRVVAKEPYGGDDHNMGAFWIRPDGRYLHLYCEHYTNYTTYYRLSTNPNDGSIWNSEQSYNWMTIPNSPGVDEPGFYNSSYTNIVYLSGEGTGMGRLYNIHRIFARTPCIAYSDDWGQNWVYMGRLNSPAGGATYSNFYHKFAGNGVDRIDFIGVENHPRNTNNSVYHGYIKNGKSYNSYGVEIDTLYDQSAPSVQAFTPIFIADPCQTATSYHTGWTNELELDAHGYPVGLYQTRYGLEKYGNGSTTSFDQQNSGAADHRFFYARFNGTSWTSTELAKMGVGLHLPEQDYIGMGCIHPDDVNIVYIATQFDPRDDTEYEYREIFKGVTSDNGLTWDWTQVTFDSTQNNTRPAIPKWDSNNTAVVWTRGNWLIQTEYEKYDLVVVGIVEEHNKTLGLTAYIDANTANTTNADGSAFSPTGPSGSAGAADSQWHEYTGYGNGGSCYTAGDSGTENVPTIKTTISGLADGTYDVFAYFWADPSQDWGIRAGFETSDLLCISRQSSQFAEASGFSNSVETMGNSILLYRAYIGRKTVTGGSEIDVYLDNYDSAYNSNAPTRTTYDGVGIAAVITSPVYNPGDFSQNGKVDFIDFAVLGNGWETTYDIDDLAALAENWLYGTD